MKNLVIISLLFSFMSGNAAYDPSIFPESDYGYPIPIAGEYNLGTDTRSASGGSYLYANYLNVTVSDYLTWSTYTPQFFWESSHGCSGMDFLPDDAYDPDVVLIQSWDETEVFALVVYYSPEDAGISSGTGMPGYYMSMAQFFGPPTCDFGPLSPPQLIQDYNPAPGEPKPVINIDSDAVGTYAVVFQHAMGFGCMTATYYAGVPSLPSNLIGVLGYIEPDVAVFSPNQINVVAVKNDRSAYGVHSRTLGMDPFVEEVISAPMPSLHTPRIAYRSIPAVVEEYAITMTRIHDVGGATLHDILVSIDEGAPFAINAGMPGFPPALNAEINVFPAISYTYDVYSEIEYVTVGWHCEILPGIGVLPPQQNNMTALDIDPVTGLPISGTAYLDVSIDPQIQNRATIAIAGRYSDWIRTAVFAYGPEEYTPERLVHKHVPTLASSWKNDQEDSRTRMQNNIRVFPNPTSSAIMVEGDNVASIEIYGVTGTLVLRNRISVEGKRIDLTNLPAGTYILKLYDELGNPLKSEPLVKH